MKTAVTDDRFYFLGSSAAMRLPNALMPPLMSNHGNFIAPFEVEVVLQSHPDVLEAAVVGWPDSDNLIKPKAFVVPKSPDKASEAFAQKLQDECRHKLAPYKYPRWVEFR